MAGLVKEGAALTGLAAIGLISTGSSILVAGAVVAIVAAALGSIAAWRALSHADPAHGRSAGQE